MEVNLYIGATRQTRILESFEAIGNLREENFSIPDPTPSSSYKATVEYKESRLGIPRAYMGQPFPFTISSQFQPFISSNPLQ